MGPVGVNVCMFRSRGAQPFEVALGRGGWDEGYCARLLLPSSACICGRLQCETGKASQDGDVLLELRRIDFTTGGGCLSLWNARAGKLQSGTGGRQATTSEQ